MEEQQEVKEILKQMEALAQLLSDNVHGDQRISNWAADVEMVAREYKNMPLIPGARFLSSEDVQVS